MTSNGSTFSVDELTAFVEAVSPAMKALEAAMGELAHSNVPVLVMGENGSGKRTVARRIHQTSERCHETFQVIPCASLSFEMLDQDAAGIFQCGTIFLEEIGELSRVCQLRLLEKLSEEEGQGGARLICGSAADLSSEVQAGRFREDLYYRISGVCLRLPPLRQRKEDIPYLISFFVDKYAQEFQRVIPMLSAATQSLFQHYSWPGNIRELEQVAKIIVAVGDERVAMGGLREQLTRNHALGNGAQVSLKQAARAASREAEKELILKVLNKTRWNRRRAAQELQISYKALLYKLKQIGYEDVEAS